jgi:outer membrane protein assembly factor BamE (lipoprotein component of BamABCDE complex)
MLVAGCASAPALHEEDFARITPGMHQDDVRRALGEPQQREEFRRQRQVAWTYDFRDLWGYLAFMSVIFDEDARVVGKVLTRKEPEDS